MARAELDNAIAVIAKVSIVCLKSEDKRVMEAGLELAPLVEDIQKAIRGYGFVLKKLREQCTKSTAILKVLQHAIPAASLAVNRAIAAMWGNDKPRR